MKRMAEAFAFAALGAAVGGALVEVTWEIARRKYEGKNDGDHRENGPRPESKERHVAQA